MDTEVIEGAIMIKYRTLILSARRPTMGLNNDGSRPITERNPAKASEILNLAINSGNIGAKKEEYMSCTRWVIEMVST
jgi:hypothetical protein